MINLNPKFEFPTLLHHKFENEIRISYTPSTLVQPRPLFIQSCKRDEESLESGEGCLRVHLEAVTAYPPELHHELLPGEEHTREGEGRGGGAS